MWGTGGSRQRRQDIIENQTVSVGLHRKGQRHPNPKATKGGRNNRVPSAANTHRPSCDTDGGRIIIHHLHAWCYIFALLVQPPFHHAHRVQPTLGVYWCSRRSSDRKRAITTPQSRRKVRRTAHGERAWGSPTECGESPQKMGWWGNETSRGKKKTRLTMSAFSFPQFTQILSKIFFTLTMKPSGEIRTGAWRWLC